MKKRLLLLLASGALLFTSCNAVNPNNPSDKEEGKEDEPAIIDDDPEFSEFDFFSSSSSYGRNAIGKGIEATINALFDSTAVKLGGKINKVNVDLNTKEDSENPEFNVSEKISDVSGNFELGLSGYSFAENEVTSLDNLVAYLDVNNIKGKSTLSYISEANNKTTTTSETIFENGKGKFYLKEGNLYGDLSDENIVKIFDTLAKADEYIFEKDIEQFDELKENPKFVITDLYENSEINLYNELVELVPMLDAISAEAIVAAIKLLDSRSNLETKQEMKDLFEKMGITFYSALQKSDYYFKVTYNIDEVDDLVYIADYINNKMSENEDENNESFDFNQLLEDKDMDLGNANLSGEIRFAKNGNVEFDINSKMDMDLGADVEMDEGVTNNLVKPRSLTQKALDIDTSFAFDSSITFSLSFESDTSYLDKLPSAEELNTYHEIDGNLLFEEIEELIEEYLPEAEI